jgi:hypothetical protein
MGLGRLGEQEQGRGTDGEAYQGAFEATGIEPRQRKGTVSGFSRHEITHKGPMTWLA